MRATGPINQFAGLVITGNGQRIEWRRDPLDMYAFELEVPAGVDAIDIEFQSLSPTASDQGRVAMTTELMSVQWSRLLLYPAGYDARRIRFEPSCACRRAGSSAARWKRPAAKATCIASSRWRWSTWSIRRSTPAVISSASTWIRAAKARCI